MCCVTSGLHQMCSRNFHRCTMMAATHMAAVLLIILPSQLDASGSNVKRHTITYQCDDSSDTVIMFNPSQIHGKCEMSTASINGKTVCINTNWKYPLRNSTPCESITVHGCHNIKWVYRVDGIEHHVDFQGIKENINATGIKENINATAIKENINATGIKENINATGGQMKRNYIALWISLGVVGVAVILGVLLWCSCRRKNKSRCDCRLPCCRGNMKAVPTDDRAIVGSLESSQETL